MILASCQGRGWHMVSTLYMLTTRKNACRLGLVFLAEIAKIRHSTRRWNNAPRA